MIQSQVWLFSVSVLLFYHPENPYVYVNKSNS